MGRYLYGTTEVKRIQSLLLLKDKEREERRKAEKLDKESWRESSLVAVLISFLDREVKVSFKTEKTCILFPDEILNSPVTLEKLTGFSSLNVPQITN